MSPFGGINFDDLKKKAEEGIEAVQEGVQNFDASAAMKKIGDTANEGINGIGKAIECLTKRTSEEPEVDLSRDFIALLCFLAAVDGSVSQEEEEKLLALANEIDADAEARHQELIAECVAKVENESAEFGYLASAKINAKRTLETAALSHQEKKAVCWNLFAVASANGVSMDEADFIRYVCEQADLDKSIVEELSGYNDAIIELGAAREQLKASNRSFSEIDPLVCEIANREQTVIEAAEALVSDN